MSRMEDYESLFQQRGNRYHQAMKLVPNARDREFAQVVRHLRPRPNDMVADVPAGGGYLGRYLPASTTYWAHEPCDTFGPAPHVDRDKPEHGPELLPLPWKDQSIDAVVSLAGVHHLECKQGFFDECRRVTREDGRFVLSDVDEDSAVARFLDDFVGAHNSTGHEGLYLSNLTRDELAASGWSVHLDQRVSCPWVFADAQQLAFFFRTLFDLQGLEDSQILEAVEAYLGINSSEQLEVAWSLRTLVALPTHHPQ